MSFCFSRPLTVIALWLALSGVSRAEITLAIAPALHRSASADPSCDANGHFSVLRTPRQDCAAHDGAAATSSSKAQDWEPLNLNVMQAEIYAFAVIGVAQIRGGTRLLSDVWYAGALLVPPFMEKHPVTGLSRNYAAITPPFIALGLMNGYLDRVDAVEPRIFLSNFIGFNLGLLWSHAVLDTNSSSAHDASSPNSRRVSSYLFPLPDGDGAGMSISLQW